MSHFVLSSAYRRFRGRDLLTLADYTAEEIQLLLDLAIQLKKRQKEGKPTPLLSGKTLGMIFEKSSTRTRVSFEVGMYQLGGQALFLSSHDLQLGRGETIADTARVLSRYVDGIMIRTFAHEKAVELARYATVPVINGLTDDFHPCQVLADLLTILEKKGTLRGVKLAYVGDGNNMAHSLMQAGAIMGMQVAVATPPGYEPKAEVLEYSRKQAEASGGQVFVTNTPEAAVADADVVYTDVWTSMGQEQEAQQRLRDFRGYQVDAKLMKQAKADALFMHCLPAHRGEEVADDVADGPQSVIFDQAENRLHAQKAVLVALMS
ncbi:MAG: ornithine carbamoyltransferase [Bacillaceae bacterium G1]|nr:ornithine carbamoyltransferase [Bacillota bacterium]OJF18236.1 MAG: ornithine carbamoyltransferase [Bacillaceae bacterium G1]